MFHQHKIGKAPGGKVRLILIAGAVGLSVGSAKLAAAQPLIIADLHPVLAQEGGDDEKDVPPAQVEKYIAVYKSMQKDRSLTVDAAAQKQGMTTAEFRTLEGRIERDDALRERVRKALRPASASTAGEESEQ